MTGSDRGAQPLEQHVSASTATLYRTPRDAMEAPEEKLAYVALLDADAIAIAIVDPASEQYGTVVGQWDPPAQASPDEFHHYGWNICSSALGGDHRHHGDMNRRYLVVPGIRSSRIYMGSSQDKPETRSRPCLVTSTRALGLPQRPARGRAMRPYEPHPAGDLRSPPIWAASENTPSLK